MYFLDCNKKSRFDFAGEKNLFKNVKTKIAVRYFDLRIKDNIFAAIKLYQL